MKRFTETDKWRDPWFRKLSPLAKLLWSYLCDHCNSVGVIELDMDAAIFDIGEVNGERVSQKHLDELKGRANPVNGGKLYLPKFIHFQYGRLSEDCKAHKNIILLVERLRLTKADDCYLYPVAPPPKVEEPPPEKPTPGPNDDPLPIPQKLQTPAFVAAWQRWMTIRRGMKNKPKDWAELFRDQLAWLEQHDLATAIEILGYSTRNNYQGLQPPKSTQNNHQSKPTPKYGPHNPVPGSTPNSGF